MSVFSKSYKALYCLSVNCQLLVQPRSLVLLALSRLLRHNGSQLEKRSEIMDKLAQSHSALYLLAHQADGNDLAVHGQAHGANPSKVDQPVVAVTGCAIIHFLLGVRLECVLAVPRIS